jgi:hypothetical protein
MGYESRLYMVVKSSFPEHPRFCWQIAQYDIAKFPPVSNLFRKGNPKSKFTDCGLYLDGRGDEPVTEDMYGDKLREASLETVIKVLKACEDSYKAYQRFPPLLAMLESFKGVFKDMVVIHFGH